MGMREAVLAKAPYRSRDIKDGVPMETTNKIWCPVSPPSNQTRSILRPTCGGWAGAEHLCGGGGERLPARAPGRRYHLWRVKSWHVPSLAGQRAVVPVPAQSIAIRSCSQLLPLLLPGWWESVRHGRTLRWVSWERGVSYCYSVCLLSPIL